MAEKILIIDDDLDTLRLVGLMLQRQGYDIVAANNGEKGLAQANAEHPDLILLDVMMPGMDGYEVAKRLRANPDTVDIPILMFTAKSQINDKVTGFESGADDYLTKPTHPDELQSHVKMLLARFSKRERKESPPEEAHHNCTIGVIAARGGLGVSAVAVNLGMQLHNSTQGEVIIAELQPGRGTLWRDFDAKTDSALSDLLSLPANQINQENVAEKLFKHKTGIQFLFASEKPSDLPLAENALPQYNAILPHLQKLSDYLLLDFGSSLPRFSQQLLSLCDFVIVLVEGEEHSLAHTRALLDDLHELNVDGAKLRLLLNNRVRSELLFTLGQAQQKLGHAISLSLTPAPEIFTQAKQMHIPAILHQAGNITAQQFAKLAKLITEQETQ